MMCFLLACLLDEVWDLNVAEDAPTKRLAEQA
jgi:hypothetical protein